MVAGAPIQCGRNRQTTPPTRTNHLRPCPASSHKPTAVATAVPNHQSWRSYKSASAAAGGCGGMPIAGARLKQAKAVNPHSVPRRASSARPVKAANPNKIAANPMPLRMVASAVNVLRFPPSAARRSSCSCAAPDVDSCAAFSYTSAASISGTTVKCWTTNNANPASAPEESTTTISLRNWLTADSLAGKSAGVSRIVSGVVHARERPETDDINDQQTEQENAECRSPFCHGPNADAGRVYSGR